MSAIQTSAAAPARPRSAGGITGRLTRRMLDWARSGVELGRAALQVVRERRALIGMDARALKDLGISRATAEHEARRPFLEQLQEIRRRRRGQ
jgi:uncharacterized protein YjiS (DUF1127 family)